MKRYSKKFLSVNSDNVYDSLRSEIAKQSFAGKFRSPHHVYDQVMDRVCKFWTSMRYNDTDPETLFDLASVALRAMLEMCETSRNDLIDSWLAECPECGWKGLSRDCAENEPRPGIGGTAMICPRCAKNDDCVGVNYYDPD